jgi:hypothetical protein
MSTIFECDNMRIENAKVTLYENGTIDIDAELSKQDGELLFKLGKGVQTPAGLGFVYSLKKDVELWLWNIE